MKSRTNLYDSPEESPPPMSSTNWDGHEGVSRFSVNFSNIEASVSSPTMDQTTIVQLKTPKVSARNTKTPKESKINSKTPTTASTSTRVTRRGKPLGSIENGSNVTLQNETLNTTRKTNNTTRKKLLNFTASNSDLTQHAGFDETTINNNESNFTLNTTHSYSLRERSTRLSYAGTCSRNTTKKTIKRSK